MDVTSREEIILIGDRAFGTDSKEVKQLDAILAASDETNFNFLLEEIDQSDYAFRDWAEALLAFDGWLEEKGSLTRPLGAIVGYIHCCTLTTAPAIGLPSLKVIVSKSLTEYGFEEICESQK
ncbi:MAG: hypothetical protein P1U87_13945 [Verrucomicrobiales bacterium]|nr:hypothetical protein [Verrucomicrobiales bacterium]